MKFFLRVPTIRAVILFLFLFLSKNVHCQLATYELFDIVKLYNDEQYDVVMAKLTSKGFRLEESTPDYLSEGIEHKGAFFMVWPLEGVGPYGKTVDLCRFRFNTDSYSSYKEVNIKFNMYYPSGGLFTYNDIVKRLKSEIKYWYVGGDNKSTTFIDSAYIYGKDADNPGKLFWPLKPRQTFVLRYSDYGVFNLEGEVNFNLVKFPIENVEEYLKNPTKYSNYISVPVKQRGNIHYVELNIGGVSYTYIIDSGASEMMISKSMETKFLDLGIIRNSDYLPSRIYVLADGSQKTYRRVKLSSIRIAGERVEDIIVAITDDSSPLLLGKSFLNKFKSWKLNNSNSTIELNR